ncbi:MAG: GAF domain-containing protein [Proteobacteria bacterium]|nr:GAF domain-containing protein [Pseudomonadota bacterium]MBU1688889.1 GAF domain-containing protein [Pseudomonadota bacterium]
MISPQNDRPDIDTIIKENRRFGKLLAIQNRIGYERNLDRLLPMIISEISELVEAERTTIFLVDWERMELIARHAEGLPGNEISIKMRMGIVGWAVLARQDVSIANAAAHPYFNPEIDQIHGFKTESILVAPIINGQGEVIGALELLNKKSGVFSGEDRSLAMEKAAELGDQNRLEHLETGEANTIIDSMVTATACERGSLFKIDKEQGQLISMFAQGLDGDDIRLSLNLGIAGLVAVTGVPLNITDTTTDTRFDFSFDRQTGFTTRNILCLPIMNHQNEVIGVIEVINKIHGCFGHDDIRIMRSLGSIVAIAIQNAQMLAEQDRQFLSIIEVMAASIDAKDPLTAGHSAQVTEYAVGIALQLGYKEAEIDVISVAGLLHDYGKLGVDDKILKKPGTLSPEEYCHIQKHVGITRSILGKMNFARKYRMVPMIAAAHHEYLDGSGYDSGLSEQEIPFMAKIITVADVFDALTSSRHYREAMPVPEAIDYLETKAGIKYDPGVVTALKRYLANQPLKQL